MDSQPKKRKTEQSHDTKDDSDVLCLNVGGKIIHVLRRTLTSVPDSMLAACFSGRWDDSIEKDRDGNFFIDQDSTLFEMMIKCLRDKSNDAGNYPSYPPTQFHRKEDQAYFYRMIDYYGLTSSIYPVGLKVRWGLEESVERKSPWKVETKEKVTFDIVSENHDRIIESFQIKIGSSVEKFIIYNEHVYDRSTREDMRTDFNLVGSNYSGDGIPRQELKGPDGSENLEKEAGTIIRCEEYGKRYYVNDRLVVSCKELPEDVLPDNVAQTFELHKIFDYTKNPNAVYKNYQFFIGVKGEMEIIDIVFRGDID